MSGFRLSPQQRRLCQLDEGSPHSPYRTQALIRIAGELDAERLERALRALIDRYEILRTVFPPVPGLELPLQSPGESRLDVSVEDWSGRDEEEWAELARTDLEEPIDISKPGLLRVRLADLGGAEHLLVWTQPALYGDRASVAVLAAELMDRYAADGLPEGDEEPMQYADLAEWLNEILEEDAEEGLAFWRRNAGQAAPGAFPLARPADPGGFRPRYATVELGRELMASLDAHAAGLETSAEALLYALWAILLARYTDSEALRLDTYFDGRSYEGLDAAVGLFARYLPIAVEISGDDTPGAVVARLARRCQEAGEWQEYFVSESSPGPDRPTTYGFSWHDADTVPALRSFSCRGSLEPHLLELSCDGRGEDLEATLVYDANRIEAAAVEGVAAALTALCDDAMTRPETAVSRLRLVAEDERSQLVSSAGSDPPPPEASRITDLIQARVEAGPDRPAVTCGEASLSYGELWARAGGVAARLQEQGVRSDDVVAVCCVRSVDLVVAVIGVLRSGAAYLPLDPTYPVERLEFMARDAAARIAVHHPPTAEVVESLPVEGIDLAGLGEAEPALITDASEDDLAYVIYTSGSTGVPKGVAVTQSNLVHSTTARFHFYSDAPERFLLLSSYAFDSSVVGIFWTLTSGGNLILPEEGSEQDIGLLSELAERLAVTHTLCLPTLYNVLLEQTAAERLRSLKLVAVAGEACPTALAQRHFELHPGARLYNEYGPTEATVWAIAGELDAESVVPTVPIGRPVPYSRTYLLDESLEPVPAGIAGEIYLGGAGITRGYLGRPELTEERFPPDPFAGNGAQLYRTGDRGRRRRDGQIEFLGRVDHQVKIRGYRIEPGEIEARLEQLEGVRQAVVVPRATESGELSLAAYIVASGAEEPGVSELRAALSAHLPDYMIPASFTKLEEMPLTPTGKVDRNALPEPEQQRPELAAAYEAPEGRIETYLVGRWQEILQTDRIGVHDNFFELGGNSIQAAVFMNRIRGEMDDFVHVGRLFEHPTVRELAGYLEAEHGEAIGRLGSGVETAPAPIEPSAEDEVIGRIADMSDDEVDSMLEKLIAEEEGGA